MRNLFSRKQGFTLVEVLVATAVLVVVLVGLLRLFVYCSTLGNLSRNLTYMMNQAQGKMDEIKNTSFSLISTNYGSGGTPGNTFSTTNPTGKGVIYIDTSNSSLYTVEIDISWQNKDGRIIGEDTDLDGVIDSGEDLDSNGKLDSQAKLVAYIAQR